MLLRTIAALAALSAGCSPAGETGKRKPQILLSPTEETREPLERAIFRWEAAGVAPGLIEFDDGGVPVGFVDELIDSGRVWGDGSPIYYDGAVYRSGRGELLSVAVWRYAPKETWAHEVGHVYGVRGHVASGIMNEYGRAPIDSVSLTAVCIVAECDSFNPEGE